MTTYRPLSRFILFRGLILCLLLLLGWVALLLRAAQGGPLAPRLWEYAEAFRFAALVAFGCGTLGSFLMEDLLRYYGE